jgi:Uma2 family endonuclease
MATVSASPPVRVVLTYDDLRATPDDGRRYEIMEGELAVTPAPSTTHQRISRNLEFVLHTHVTQHGLGEVLDAPVDVILDRTTVVEPDLVFVARARVDHHGAGHRGAAGPGGRDPVAQHRAA